MKVWSNNKFHGYYPVGSAAVVVAPTPERAAELLNETLASMKLTPDVKAEDMKPVPTKEERVFILEDGNY